jgi:hypothetical protein
MKPRALFALLVNVVRQELIRPVTRIATFSLIENKTIGTSKVFSSFLQCTWCTIVAVICFELIIHPRRSPRHGLGNKWGARRIPQITGVHRIQTKNKFKTYSNNKSIIKEKSSDHAKAYLAAAVSVHAWASCKFAKAAGTVVALQTS